VPRYQALLLTDLVGLHRPDASAQVVSSMPEVCIVRRSTSTPGFLILATDGLWSSCSSAEAIAFVDQQLSIHDNPQWAADQLLSHVLLEQSSSDNVYITVVLLKPEPPGAASTPSVLMANPEFARQQSQSFTPPTGSPCPSAAFGERDANEHARRRELPHAAAAITMF
jgi:serine/threonine protein phosphatase PrpC